jgi:hypothetical protein
MHTTKSASDKRVRAASMRTKTTGLMICTDGSGHNFVKNEKYVKKSAQLEDAQV